MNLVGHVFSDFLPILRVLPHVIFLYDIADFGLLVFVLDHGLSNLLFLFPLQFTLGHHKSRRFSKIRQFLSQEFLNTSVIFNYRLPNSSFYRQLDLMFIIFVKNNRLSNESSGIFLIALLRCLNSTQLGILLKVIVNREIIRHLNWTISFALGRQSWHWRLSLRVEISNINNCLFRNRNLNNFFFRLFT